MPGHGTPAPRALIGFNSKGIWGSYVISTSQILRTIPYKPMGTAEILSINPLYPPILGDFLELGDTPRPPPEGFPSGLPVPLSLRGALVPKQSREWWWDAEIAAHR